MPSTPIPLRHGPPEVRHRICGERSEDLPVGGIEVLMHRKVTLTQWALRKASDFYWRLYWPQNRGARVIYEGRSTPLIPGRLYLIPPLTPFDTESAAPFTKWYFHFTLHGADLTPAGGVHEFSPTSQMKALLSKTCPKSVVVNALQESMRPWLVIELITLVIRHAPDRLWCATHPDARLGKAIKLMNQAFSQKLTLQQLSKHAGLSARGLGQLFLEQTGFAPIRYLTELRLNHCCRLLRHSTLPIEAVAEQCGFANRFYLSRMLRKYRHTTPAAFRRQTLATAGSR